MTTSTRSTPRFRDQVVVITGASAGIGAAAARAFAAEGARVVLAARGRDALDELAAELRGQGGEALVVPTDVGDDAACRRLIDEAVATHSQVDVLVNNAGLHHRGPFPGLTPEQATAMVDLNLRAPILLTRLVLDGMLARGSGAVVNVASLAGCIPVPESVTYSATKFGLRGFSLALGEELRGSGVRVAAVSPGPVSTQFILGDLDEVSDLTFSQPMSSPEQVAAAILDCAADGRSE
ncbi:MAG TPA: SDR family NAD(P)-dependent oxidoreductase, partial [Polyangiaceae bacterium LLY-WYZ-14_1]|nr:SDR family NAD(P)-dependent oxidoreductase [Polyangiaceae bacterium LLY-WYZ-14_1]